MEECVNGDFATSGLKVRIKKEPTEEGEDDFDSSKPDTQVIKSLVLKFVKNQKGGYSVTPFIKPDPFFEEDLGDLCYEDLGEIKSEEVHLNHDGDEDENVNVKLEKPEDEGGDHPTDEVKLTERENRLKDRNKLKKDNSSISHCHICYYTNKEKLVERHMRRVHVSTTKHSCPFCNMKNFKEPISVDCHILKEHRDIDGALDHIKRTIFDCTFCRYKSLKRNNLRRHLTTHGDSRLKKHLQVKGGEKNFLEIDPKHDIKKALSTVKYDCFHCPYFTKDKGSIIKHLRLHREGSQLPFCCEGCNKKFNEKNSLDSHLVKRHIEDKELLKQVTNRVYECEFCNYKDVNKNKVIRHKRARHVKKERKRKKKRDGKIKLKVVKKINE